MLKLIILQYYPDCEYFLRYGSTPNRDDIIYPACAKSQRDYENYNSHKYIDYIGVENFHLITSPWMTFINRLKAEANMAIAVFECNNCQKRLKQQIYSKSLFPWSGRFQDQIVNSRSSFLQVGENDGGRYYHLLFYHELRQTEL